MYMRRRRVSIQYLTSEMSVCCPHMPPDNRHRYAATTKKMDIRMNELKYRGRVVQPTYL